MKLISHRGNIVGPNPSRENTPSYIDTTISAGYEVEIDVNFIHGKFYLGHDTPDYEISETWLERRKEKLWIHCKNLDAASRLHDMNKTTSTKHYKFFCHSSDSFVLTSNGYTWVHDLTLDLSDTTIIPLLSDKDIINYKGMIPYAVCTDYVSLATFNLKQKGLYL